MEFFHNLPHVVAMPMYFRVAARFWWSINACRSGAAESFRKRGSPILPANTNHLAMFANDGILIGIRGIQTEEPRCRQETSTLTEHYDRFVEEQINAGKYKNASEALRAGLGLLEQQTQFKQERLTLLKKLAADGFRSLDQGHGLSIASEKGLRSTIAKIGRRAAKARQAQEKQ